MPAYIVGMVLAGTVGKDHVLVRHLRTLTFDLLTPFMFEKIPCASGGPENSSKAGPAGSG